MVLAEANLPELLPEVLCYFDCVTDVYDDSELQALAAKFISKELKKEFGDFSWQASWWYIPVPRVLYTKAGLPHLNIGIDVYVAASVKADCWTDWWIHRNFPCALISKVRKEVAKFNAPLVLLEALMEGKASQFEIVQKERHWTTWEVNGFEARLPDSFVSFIRTLKGKSLGKALETMGLIGKGVAPLIEQGLMSAPAKEVPPQLAMPSANDYETMVVCLKEQMGYPKTKAEEAAKYVMEKFASEKLEEKIKHALSYLSA